MAARVLAVSLLVVALAAAGILVAHGEPGPSAVPALVLVVLLGIAVNRGAFYPTELVATAEAAVLFAAVVGFRTDSALLGPLVVALAVGPLDWVHWRQRAFTRMAYNSGSQGLAILAGALVFRQASIELGSSPPALIGAAALAAVPYALADSCCGAALLLARRDTSARDAARHQWSLNGLAVPLACVGSLAGYLATAVGWWPAFAVLAPVPWIPELVLVHTRRLRRAPSRTHVRVLGACVVVGALAVAAWLGWSSRTATLPALVALAVMLGLELRVSAARAVPPIAAGVAVTAAVVSGPDALVMAAVVGATTTATAWMLVRNAQAGSASRAIVVSAGAGLLCGAVVAALPSDEQSVSVVLSALAGAGAYEGAAVVACRARADVAASAIWTAPVVLVAALLAASWGVLDVPGVLLFAVGFGGALVCVAWSAAPPWGSRLLGRWLGTRVRHRLRVGLLVLAAAAGCAAIVAMQSNYRGARVGWALGAAALAETAVGMTLAAVRQWRFAPRARAHDVLALLVIAAGIGIGYPLLAFAGSAWAVLALVGLLVATVVIGWPVATVADSREAAR